MDSVAQAIAIGYASDSLLEPRLSKRTYDDLIDELDRFYRKVKTAWRDFLIPPRIHQSSNFALVCVTDVLEHKGQSRVLPSTLIQEAFVKVIEIPDATGTSEAVGKLYGTL
jgi:hypothetical protein